MRALLLAVLFCAVPARGWDQYQVIMWSTGSAADPAKWIDRLRELGPIRDSFATLPMRDPEFNAGYPDRSVRIRIGLKEMGLEPMRALIFKE